MRELNDELIPKIEEYLSDYHTPPICLNIENTWIVTNTAVLFEWIREDVNIDSKQLYKLMLNKNTPAWRDTVSYGGEMLTHYKRLTIQFNKPGGWRKLVTSDNKLLDTEEKDPTDRDLKRFKGAGNLIQWCPPLGKYYYNPRWVELADYLIEDTTYKLCKSGEGNALLCFLDNDALVGACMNIDMNVHK